MSQPITIDAVFVGTEPDGTPVFGSPFEALTVQIVRGVVSVLMEYPREVLNGLALGSVAGMCIYLACGAGRPRSP